MTTDKNAYEQFHEDQQVREQAFVLWSASKSREDLALLIVADQRYNEKLIALLESKRNNKNES